LTSVVLAAVRRSHSTKEPSQSSLELSIGASELQQQRLTRVAFAIPVGLFRKLRCERTLAQVASLPALRALRNPIAVILEMQSKQPAQGRYPSEPALIEMICETCRCTQIA
jgi:hypothetical protein